MLYFNTMCRGHHIIGCPIKIDFFRQLNIIPTQYLSNYLLLYSTLQVSMSQSQNETNQFVPERVKKRKRFYAKTMIDELEMDQINMLKPHLSSVRRKLYIKLAYCSYSITTYSDSFLKSSDRNQNHMLSLVKQLFANKILSNTRAFEYICDKYINVSSENFSNNAFDYHNFRENNFICTFISVGIQYFSYIWYQIVNYRSEDNEECVNYNPFNVTYDLLENNIVFNNEIQTMNLFLRLISELMTTFTYHKQLTLVYDSFCLMKTMTDDEKLIIEDNKGNKYSYQMCTTGTYGKIIHVLQFKTAKKYIYVDLLDLNIRIENIHPKNNV